MTKKTTAKKTTKLEKQSRRVDKAIGRKLKKPGGAKPFVRRLTDEQVAEIARRREDGEDRRDLAEEFGISIVYVGQVGRTARVTRESAAPIMKAGGITKASRPKWMKK
jgi:hypothetical protein